MGCSQQQDRCDSLRMRMVSGIRRPRPVARKYGHDYGFAAGSGAYAPGRAASGKGPTFIEYVKIHESGIQFLNKGSAAPHLYLELFDASHSPAIGTESLGLSRDALVTGPSGRAYTLSMQNLAPYIRKQNGTSWGDGYTLATSMLLQPYALGSDMVIFSNGKTLDITLDWDTWTITLGGRFISRRTIYAKSVNVACRRWMMLSLIFSGGWLYIYEGDEQIYANDQGCDNFLGVFGDAGTRGWHVGARKGDLTTSFNGEISNLFFASPAPSLDDIVEVHTATTAHDMKLALNRGIQDPTLPSMCIPEHTFCDFRLSLFQINRYNDKRIGVVITTHGNNGLLVEHSIKSYLTFLPKHTSYFLFVNESDDPNMFALKDKYAHVEYIYIADQTTNGGLTGTWNQGIDKCLLKHCDVIILSNDDLIIDSSICHILHHAAYGIPVNQLNYYGPVTNNPGPAIQNQLQHSKHMNTGAKAINHNLNGFFMVFPKDALVLNKYDEFHYFNPKYPFGGNECEWYERFKLKGGQSILVSDTFVYHHKLQSWRELKVENIYIERPKGNE